MARSRLCRAGGRRLEQSRRHGQGRLRRHRSRRSGNLRRRRRLWALRARDLWSPPAVRLRRVGERGAMTGPEETADTQEGLGLRTSTRDPEELRSSLEAWLATTGLGTRVISLEIPEHTGVSSLSVMLEVECEGRPA